MLGKPLLEIVGAPPPSDEPVDDNEHVRPGERLSDSLGIEVRPHVSGLLAATERLGEQLAQGELTLLGCGTG